MIRMKRRMIIQIELTRPGPIIKNDQIICYVWLAFCYYEYFNELSRILMHKSWQIIIKDVYLNNVTLLASVCVKFILNLNL